MYIDQSDFLLWVDADSGAYRQNPDQPAWVEEGLVTAEGTVVVFVGLAAAAHAAVIAVVAGDAPGLPPGQSVQPLQSSPSSQTPSKSHAGQPVQAEVSKPSQVGLHARVPPVQPSPLSPTPRIPAACSMQPDTWSPVDRPPFPPRPRAKSSTC
mgnify:CR=1 FL=1